MGTEAWTTRFLQRTAGGQGEGMLPIKRMVGGCACYAKGLGLVLQTREVVKSRSGWV